MNYEKKFKIPAGSRVRLKNLDPDFTDKDESKESAIRKVATLQQQLDELQFALLPKTNVPF